MCVIFTHVQRRWNWIGGRSHERLNKKGKIRKSPRGQGQIVSGAQSGNPCWEVILQSGYIRRRGRIWKWLLLQGQRVNIPTRQNILTHGARQKKKKKKTRQEEGRALSNFLYKIYIVCDINSVGNSRGTKLYLKRPRSMFVTFHKVSSKVNTRGSEGRNNWPSLKSCQYVNTAFLLLDFTTAINECRDTAAVGFVDLWPCLTNTTVIDCSAKTLKCS